MNDPTPIDPALAEQLLNHWWCAYDEAEFDTLATLLTEDVHFQCRTDTGTTDYEEFVRAEMTGRDQVMEWQRQHRLDSPYPLRHHGTNFHVTSHSAGRCSFRQYIHVTQVQGGFPSAVPAGVVTGVVSRGADGNLQIADLVVTLDTMESVPLRQLRPDAGDAGSS